MSAIAGRADVNRLLCDLEPIHAPGAIQPHGALLAVRTDNWRISHASANLRAIVCLGVESVLGAPVDDVVGSASACSLRTALDSGIAAIVLPDLEAPDGRRLNVGARRVDGHVVIDIEPAINPKDQISPGRLAQSIIQRLTASMNGNELCQIVVDGLKAVTGYDRVMAYRFAADDHGEVIAENRQPELPPFLGLHYPAGDIPPQARRLYVRQPVVAVMNSAYIPVPLLVDAGLNTGLPLDLTWSALRSVSPVHRHYLRNMGAAASLSVGLVHGNRLWGMLVCHHATPRTADAEMRAAIALIGQFVSVLLEGQEQAESAGARRTCDATLGMLMDKVRAQPNLVEALAASSDEFLGLVEADGAVICLTGKRRAIGHTLPDHAIDQLWHD